MTKIIDLCGCMTLDRQHPGVPVYGFNSITFELKRYCASRMPLSDSRFIHEE